jgi:hypothetical protein
MTHRKRHASAFQGLNTLSHMPRGILGRGVRHACSSRGVLRAWALKDSPAADSGKDAGPASWAGDLCDAQFEPCGGDLVGTWTYDHECWDPVRAVQGFNTVYGVCKDGPTATVTANATGSVTFGADGRAQHTVDRKGQMVVKVPTACLSEFDELVDASTSCKRDLEGTLRGSACVTQHSLDQKWTSSARWRAVDGRLLWVDGPDTCMFEGSRKTDEVIRYCVQGDKLTLVRSSDEYLRYEYLVRKSE